MPDLDLSSKEAKAAVDAAAKDLAERMLAERLEQETAGLRENNKKLLAEKKAMQERLKTLPEDFDAEQYRALVEAESKRQEEEAKKSGAWDKLKTELVTRHQEELAKFARERDEAVKRYEEFFVVSQLTDAIAKADGIPEILMPKVRANVKLIHGERGDALMVVDEDGNPRVKDGQGAQVSLSDFIGQLKSDDVWARGFKSSGASGGGANGSAGGQGGAKTMKRSAFNELSAKARMEAAKAGITLVD